MSQRISRRDFIKTGLAAAVGAASLPLLGNSLNVVSESADFPIPRRILGKTGASVSILGLGGAWFQSSTRDAALVEKIVLEAIEGGINFFDTARSYGRSEQNLSSVMKTARRQDLFLASKTDSRNYDGVMRDIETSLKMLGTDYLDLLQMHYITYKDRVSFFGEPGGALSALLKLREQKVIRFIGMTGHPNFPQVRQALEMYDFDTLLCFANPKASTRPSYDAQMPIALKKNMGIIAMKPYGGGDPCKLVGTGAGKSSASLLLRFAMTPPVNVVIPAVSNLQQLRENMAIARSYKPLSDEERKLLVAQVNPAGAASPKSEDIKPFRAD